MLSVVMIECGKYIFVLLIMPHVLTYPGGSDTHTVTCHIQTYRYAYRILYLHTWRARHARTQGKLHNHTREPVEGRVDTHSHLLAYIHTATNT